jgi:adenylate cyclase class 2
MFEIETKYRLADETLLRQRLTELGASEGGVERHTDTYFRHPSRDFVKTREALRIRCVDSLASVTYKGPKLELQDAALKAREEIEWCLAPGDADGSQMERLLLALGFTAVATVRKQRQSFSWPNDRGEFADFTVTIDHVEQVGDFAEIELVVPDSVAGRVDAAGRRIGELAERLGLTDSVPSSYLTMLLNG